VSDSDAAAPDAPSEEAEIEIAVSEASAQAGYPPMMSRKFFWGAITIILIWVAVLFVGVFSEAQFEIRNGDEVVIPGVWAIAAFAFLATWVLAVYAFGRDDG
jgi:hypothetical protein